MNFPGLWDTNLPKLSLFFCKLWFRCASITCCSSQFSGNCIVWTVIVRVDARRWIDSNGLRVAEWTGYAIAANSAVAALKWLAHRVHRAIAAPWVVEVKITGWISFVCKIKIESRPLIKHINFNRIHRPFIGIWFVQNISCNCSITVEKGLFLWKLTVQFAPKYTSKSFITS